MRFADLHTHTYHSDGTRSPREVIDVAKAHGIDIVSISDHDNTAAYFEIKAHADAVGVTLVPGIELSCAYDGVDVHILAYAFEPVDERIESHLRRFRETRADRGPSAPSASSSLPPAAPSDALTLRARSSKAATFSPSPRPSTNTSAPESRVTCRRRAFRSARPSH